MDLQSIVKSTPSQSTPPIMIPTDGIHKTVSPKLEGGSHRSMPLDYYLFSETDAN